MPPQAVSRPRFAATVIDESTGKRIVVGRYHTKSMAERASICAVITNRTPRYSHAQVHDTQENDDGQ